jgi:hypothetical protein
MILFSRGYDLLNSVLIVLVIDLIALGIIVEVGKKKPLNEIGAEITAKIENIEKVCQSLLNSTGEDSIVKRIEDAVGKQKDEVNYLLDKMSRKMLELEENINKFGFSLAEHVENFGGRLEKIERYEPEETIPIGESVYVDEEELKEEEEEK